MARRRRKARKNPFGKRRRRRNPRGRRRARRNPFGRRRRRRNPSAFNHAPVFTLGSSPGQDLGARMDAGLRTRPKRRRRRKLSAKTRRRRLRARALSKKARALRKRARSMKKGVRKSVALTQAKRLSTASRIMRRGGRASRSPVAKALHLRSNPGLGGIVAQLKILAPQGVVATVAAGGLALASQAIGSRISASLPPAVQPYVPAALTLVLTGAAWKVADKVAPKYKGAVAIGGIVAAILQGIAASPLAASGPIADAKRALGLGDYTMVGSLGQRAYAEAGIFRNVGDYTMVGDTGLTTDAGGAYSNKRPRNSLDNRTEMAATGDYTMVGHIYPNGGGAYQLTRPRNSLDNRSEFAMNGADDNTEFAPGEGGVLNGGMFRGPSSR